MERSEKNSGRSAGGRAVGAGAPTRRVPRERAANTVDGLVGQIRQFIGDKSLSVGDVLPTETELAALFGASRNTVREAIRTLKAYGLIESRQRVGAVITERRQEAIMEAFSFAIDLSADAFRDVQGFRRLIEINVADDLVLRPDQSYIDDAAAINERMRLAVNDQLAGELDYEFHRTLVDALGNRTLSQVYAVMKPVICHLTVIGKKRRKGVEATAQEHTRILDALRKKDRIAIAHFYSTHLEAGLEYLPKPAGGEKGWSP